MSLRPKAKTEVRKNRYKASVDAEEGRRRREDHMVEIRKNKREENLQKKRREGNMAQQSSEQQQQAASAADSSLEKLANLQVMIAGVWSDDRKLQLEATSGFRKLLSIERCPPINEVVKSGVVPRFVEFLSRDDYPELQAAWALTNIASGTSEDTKVVIDHGAVPLFVRLLGSSMDDVREQAVWALGNIAGDSPKCRDLVLAHGALMPLLAQFNEHTKVSMLRNATWTLSNFCRGKPQPSFEQTRPALSTLERLIHSNDEEVLTDACWALSYLSDGNDDKIDAVIASDVAPRLVELLTHPSPAVIIPALRTVGNIVTGNDRQTQHMIDSQALPCLFQLLTNNYKKSIKKEACWTISNITAGNVGQIQAVFEAGIIAPLVQLLQNAEFDIKKEAAWAISNATSGGTHKQIKFLVEQGCIRPLCDLLICPDPRIVSVCLEGLENILKVGEADKDLGSTDGNLFAQMIDEADGLEKLEQLQSHDNNDIYEKTVKILETFWGEDDEDEANDSQTEFAFGAAKDGFSCPNTLLSPVLHSHKLLQEEATLSSRTVCCWWRSAAKFDDYVKLKLDFPKIANLTPRLRVLRELERLALIAGEGLNEVRYKLQMYRSGDFWIPTGGLKKEELDIPQAITILLVGFTGSGKSSLVNLMYSVLGRSGLITFAQTSSGHASKRTTTYMEEHNVTRSTQNGFCVYDSRGFIYDKIEEALEELSSWMSHGVHHNQLCLRVGDYPLVEDDTETGSFRSCSKFAQRRVNCAMVVVNVAENPILILTHGDLLATEERIDVRLKLCERLGIAETNGVYDIVCLTEYGFLAEESDPVTAYALAEAVHRALLISDRGHLPKRNFQDWALLILSWLICFMGALFAFLADICSKLGHRNNKLKY
ncbi:hypothetical protein Tsubulata_048607, partial [Turnera subulata]